MNPSQSLDFKMKQKQNLWFVDSVSAVRYLSCLESDFNELWGNMFVVHMDPDAVFSAFVNELTCFVLVDTIPKLFAYCTA